MQQDSQISAYLAGLQKLIQLWKANARLPAKSLYAETWKIILKNETTFAGPFRRNRFDVPWKNFVFVDVTRNFRAARPDFSPELNLQFPRGEYGAFHSSIFVTLHSSLEYSIVSALQRIGGKCTIISAFEKDTRPTIYDHISDVATIVRNQNCLLVARKDLLGGRSLIVPADYTLYDAETKSFLHKIGNGVFDFAKKCRFKLFYILPVIGSEGEINLFVELADSKKSAADCGDGFLGFCAAHLPNRTELTRDNWFSDTRGKMNAKL
jgi:hypothetical protein